MADAALAKKLLLKPGTSLHLVSPPDGFRETLGVDEAVTSPADVVVAFMRNKVDVDSGAAAAIDAVKPRGVLWFAYPKKSSGVKTDINRDTGWESARNAGWQAVTQVSIDDTWSALRFRPNEEIGR